MAILEGKKFDQVPKTISSCLSIRTTELRTGERSGIVDDLWRDTTYFKIRIHKKGTGHLHFKDVDLLRRFNLLACQSKSWLPPADESNTESKRIMIGYEQSYNNS